MRPRKPYVIDMTGLTFGRWTVLRRGGTEHGHAMWWCRCECGEEREVQGGSLRFGKSTGCPFEHRHSGWTEDGSIKSPTYTSWLSMKTRCTNPKQPNWKYYGGRGITVCKRWKQSFAAFLADMGERPEGMTLDRIDPDRNYEPGNCRWADAETQSRNQRRHTGATSAERFDAQLRAPPREDP